MFLDEEAIAWMRVADVAGLELPAQVAEARERLESIEKQRAEMTAPASPPKMADLIAAGVPADKAREEHARLTEEARAHAELWEAVTTARGLARGVFTKVVGEHRDELIVDRLRPIVTALVEEARPHAAELSRFAPRYEGNAIVRNGTPKDLKAFQAAAELEVKFGTCCAAWRASFRASTKSYSPVIQGFDPRWVEQVHRYWERPEHVANPRLNGTLLGQNGHPVVISPTVLGVAAEEPACEFRLASALELKELYDAERLAGIEAKREAIRRFGARSI